MNTGTPELSRRKLVAMLGAAMATVAGSALAGPATPPAPAAGTKAAAGQGADGILRALRRTSFPDRSFGIEAFGARGDGRSDATGALAAAIRACHEAGGGRVVVPAGVYATGPVHLLSNVNLHLEDDAVLSFSTDPARYLPLVFSRWEGMELMNYSPLVYARGQENIAITGSGTLQGNADDSTWWPWKGENSERHWELLAGRDQASARARLENETEAGVPVARRIYGEGAWLRPPLLQVYDCRRVLVEGVTLRNSPFWMIHPVLSQDVVVSGVKCYSHGPNSDGCNPESCSGVLIENCDFDTGDDCIAIKSGRNADGRRIAVPSENIVIRNCRMRAGHGGIVIGSEISGGVHNVYAQNCQMDSPELERALRIKTNSVRGGVIENIYFHDIRVGRVRDVLVINYHYEEGDAGQFDPLVKNVSVRDLSVAQADRVFHVRGFDRNPIRDLSLSNIRIASAVEVGVIEHVSGLRAEAVHINGKIWTGGAAGGAGR